MAAELDVETLERAALRLSPEERARLATELLESLDELPKADVEKLWLEEAVRRAAQLDSGQVALIPAEEVARKARALLR